MADDYICNAEAMHEKDEKKMEEQNTPEDSTAEMASRSGVGKTSANEDELKALHLIDAPVSYYIAVLFTV